MAAVWYFKQPHRDLWKEIQKQQHRAKMRRIEKNEQSVQFFSRTGCTAGGSSERSTGRDDGLQMIWDVCNGNESSLQSI